MADLKQCPFCGADVEIFYTGLGANYQYTIKHPRWQKNGCIFDDGKTVYANSPEKAAEMWNRRTENGKTELIRHGHWIWFEPYGALLTHCRKCSECGEIKAQEATNFCPNCGAKMDKDE